MRDRCWSRSDRLGIVNDEQVPIRPQQFGDLLELGGLGHGVGAGMLSRAKQRGTDIADDLATGPSLVLVAEPEHAINKAGSAATTMRDGLGR